MDLICLEIVNKMMNYSAPLSKLLFSAMLGGVWSVIEVCIPSYLKPISGIITYFFITGIMVSLINNRRLRNNKRLFIKCVLKGILAMWLVAGLLGGVIHVMVYYTFAGYYLRVLLLNDKKLIFFVIITIVIVIMMLTYLFSGDTRKNQKRIKLFVLGEAYEFEALVDTGNSLRDNVSGKPITIVERERFNSILKEIDNYQRLGYHFVPFNTVGVEGALIEVITADVLCIYDKENYIFERVPIGLSKNSICGDNGFQALINPQLLGGFVK